MATWPTDLPQSPNRTNYQGEGPDNVIRTPQDTGPAKQRRRFTAAVQPRPCEITLTKAQFATFQAFHHTTLADGSLTFDWIDHANGNACTYAFTAKYTWQPLGPDAFLVKMPLEIRP